MGKNSKYGPQSFEGLGLLPRDNNPMVPEDNNFKDLELTLESSILLRKATDEIKTVLQETGRLTKEQQQIAELLQKVADNFERMGDLVDDMLEESKQYRDKGISLAPDAEASIVKLTEELKARLDEILDRKLAAFNVSIQAFKVQHDSIISELKKKYEEELGKLTETHKSLTTGISAIKDKVVIPRTTFWTLAWVLFAILSFGGWGFTKFQHNPDNSNALSYLYLAVSLNVVFYIIRFANRKWFNKEELTDKQHKIEPLKLSIGQCVYWLLLGMVSMVYGTWALIGQSVESTFLMFLLPGASVLNLAWFLIRTVIYRLNQD